MTRKNFRKRIVLSWAACIVFLLFTNPGGLPVPLLVLPFALLFIGLYVSFEAIFATYTKYREPRIKRLAAAGASIGVLIFALQSLGQLTVKDIIVAAAVISVGYFYVGRTMK